MSKLVEVTGGLEHVSRLRLKEYMSQFGEVVHIHKPPASGTPNQDTATVRFARDDQAEEAVKALKAGSVSVDGAPVTGDFKGAGKGKSGSGKGARWDAPDEGSRGLLDRRRRADSSPARNGSRRSQSRSRSRSRSHSRRDSRDAKSRGGRRERSRSRARDRHKDSRSKRRSRSRDS
mmetsp:Transcript_63361/g.100129  ORF Transcript_63361/g.100129 Transcript_63361/m.100129 type:complete len:176 (+) Transcript_63361:92-619(+)